MWRYTVVIDFVFVCLISEILFRAVSTAMLLWWHEGDSHAIFVPPSCSLHHWELELRDSFSPVLLKVQGWRAGHHHPTRADHTRADHTSANHTSANHHHSTQPPWWIRANAATWTVFIQTSDRPSAYGLSAFIFTLEYFPLTTCPEIIPPIPRQFPNYFFFFLY